MSYNLHPIFVHFPIALLFLYSIIKVLPLKKWLPSFSWPDIERVLLLVGVLGAFGALLTGDAAKHLVHPERQLVAMHSSFAVVSTYIYGALLLGEIAAFANMKDLFARGGLSWLAAVSRFLERVFCRSLFSKILAVLGFFAISITGLLGGVIAYGLTADPLAPFLLKLLGITIL